MATPQTAPSIDERCANVPVVLVPMRVPAAGAEPPVVDRLALVGEPVTEVIGQPVLGTSDVDTAGVSLVHFGVIAKATPTGLGPIDLLIIGTTSLLSGFFLFFIAMLALESSRGGPLVPALVALIGMPLTGFASYYFSRRPEREGWTCVVGDRGFQIGTVKGAALDRIVVLYADEADVWFEGTTLGVSKRGSVLSVVRTLSICSEDDLSTVVLCSGALFRNELRTPLRDMGVGRIEAERFIALGEAWERARAMRLELARREIDAGRRVSMPTMDKRLVTIVPHGVDGAGRPQVGLEITRSGKKVLSGGPGEVRVRLKEGTYEIESSNARETIDRIDLGNPYLIDAYFLGDWGNAIPAQGPLPRTALIPVGLTSR